MPFKGENVKIRAINNGFNFMFKEKCQGAKKVIMVAAVTTLVFGGSLGGWAVVAASDYKAAYIPNDYLAVRQGNFEAVRAPQAWDITRGVPGVVVAVLDTGVAIDHPDLKENIWTNIEEIPNNGIDDDKNGYVDDVRGWDFVGRDKDPNPDFNVGYMEAGVQHGTIVAGVIAARGDNKEGVVGVCPNCKIMPLRVLNSQGVGDASVVVEAIEYAISNGANVINMSFVGDERSQMLYDVIKKAYNAGIVVVGAAGNDTLTNGSNLDGKAMYPVCFDEYEGENFILGVAALDNDGKRAGFSNFGKKCVDISAPGTKVYSTGVYSPGKEHFESYYTGYWSGTSVAAPLVAGVAALIKSLNPQISAGRIIQEILSSAKDVTAINPDHKDDLGRGMLDAYRAVKNVDESLKNARANKYIVTGAGRGEESYVSLFSPDGLTINKFMAYNKNFRGGITVATGDVLGNGEEQIVTGAGITGGPHVRVFDKEGTILSEFFALEDNFRGGINVVVGDFNNDGKAEIAVAPQSAYAPLVRIFDSKGNKLNEFYAYDVNFKGGVSLAAMDSYGFGGQWIVTGAGAGGGPQVRVFDWQGKVQNEFFAYRKDFVGGVNVAAGDFDSDGFTEIVATVAGQSNPYVRVFGRHNALQMQFLSYMAKTNFGSHVTVADVNRDGKLEMIFAPGEGGSPQVRVFGSKGEILSQFFAGASSWRGGASVAVLRVN